MYIEHIQVKKGDIAYSYIRLCEYSNGIRLRHYCNPVKNPFMHVLIQNCLMRRIRQEPAQKGTLFLPSGRGPGRPPIYTKEKKAFYESLGYSVRGRKLHSNRKTYYTLATAKERFKMFTQEEQERLGSPRKMLKIEKRARSIYNAAKVKSQHLTFKKALEQAILETLPLSNG